MPVRRKRIQRVQRRGRNSRQIERVSGKVVFNISSGSNGSVSGFNIHPKFVTDSVAGTTTFTDLGVAKMQALGLLFRYYRFTRMAFRWLDASLTATTLPLSGTFLAVAAFLGGDTPNTQAPVTADEVMQCPNQIKSQTFSYAAATGQALMTRAFPSVPKTNVLPRSWLISRQPLKWWVCETDISTGTVPNMAVYQGQLFVADADVYHVSNTYTGYGLSFELEYTCEFTEFQQHPTLMLGGLQEKHKQIEECDEKSDDDDESELDDASLMIIANSSTGLGKSTSERRVSTTCRGSALRAALDQAKRDEMVARSHVHRLETKVKELDGPSKVIITPA